MHIYFSFIEVEVLIFSSQALYFTYHLGDIPGVVSDIKDKFKKGGTYPI